MKYLKSASGIIAVAAFMFWFSSHSGAQSKNMDARNLGEDQTHLIWSETVAGNNEIFYRESIKGEWVSQVQLTHFEPNNVYPSIDVSTNNDVWVVWVSTNGVGTDLYFTVRIRKQWTLPQKIETGFSENSAPSVVVDASDIPWIVWSGNAEGDDDVYFTKWNGMAWDMPVQINMDNRTPDILPFIGMDTTGMPWVAWLGWQEEKYIKIFRNWNESQFEYVESTQQNISHDTSICSEVLSPVESSNLSSISNYYEGVITDSSNSSRFYLRNSIKRKSFCRWSDIR